MTSNHQSERFPKENWKKLKSMWKMEGNTEVSSTGMHKDFVASLQLCLLYEVVISEPDWE